MRRTPRALAMAAVPLLFVMTAAACTQAHLTTLPGDRPPARGGGLQIASPKPSPTGVDLDPLHVPVFIFGSMTDHPQIQPSSERLKAMLGTRARLQVTALPSAPGTAAIDFVEISPPGHRWGEVMFPAERAVFRAFARDPSLGDVLVVLTDVEVLRRPDPIPLTAYRWVRKDVEAYAGCGIPNRAIDACTQAFYLKAQTEIIRSGGTVNGA